MSLYEELVRKRWGAGLLLLFAVGMLLAVPLLQHAGINHPLSASEATNLCPLLPPPPSTLAVAKQAPVPMLVDAGSCEYFDAADKPVLRIMLSSTRQLSREGPLMTKDYFKTWMKEAEASSGNGHEVAGEWAMAGGWNNGHEQWLLFEDHGVMVVLESDRLAVEPLADYARAAQQALRKAPRPD